MPTPYFLSLSFRDAKLFPKPMKDTHRMLESIGGLSEVTKRADAQLEGRKVYNECPFDTLLASSVSNALHVLVGERPVPSVRLNDGPGAPQRIGAIDSLANSALVKITSGIRTDEETGKVVSAYGFEKGWEALITHKGSTLSTVPVARSMDLRDATAFQDHRLVTWDRFLAQHGGEEYAPSALGVVAALLSASGAASTSSIDMVSAIRASWGTTQLSEALADSTLKKHWVSLLTTGMTKNVTSLREGYGQLGSVLNFTVSRGFERVLIRDGEILVPVEEKDIDQFQRGPGWATILDGGVLKIKGIVDARPIVCVGYKAVHGSAGGAV